MLYVKMSHKTPFTFMDVEDLLLPGTPGNVCAWFSRFNPTQISYAFWVWANWGRHGPERIAEKASIAALWWVHSLSRDEEEENLIFNQYEHWCEVYKHAMKEAKIVGRSDLPPCPDTDPEPEEFFKETDYQI